jgi:hypothetical protein
MQFYWNYEASYNFLFKMMLCLEIEQGSQTQIDWNAKSKLNDVRAAV